MSHTRLPFTLLKDPELEALIGAHDGWAEADRRKPKPTFPWVQIGRFRRYRSDVVQQIIEQNTVAA
jgi:hypothetical protein